MNCSTLCDWTLLMLRHWRKQIFFYPQQNKIRDCIKSRQFWETVFACFNNTKKSQNCYTSEYLCDFCTRSQNLQILAIQYANRLIRGYLGCRFSFPSLHFLPRLRHGACAWLRLIQWSPRGGFLENLLLQTNFGHFRF